jgi:subtilase family serine protease
MSLNKQEIISAQVVLISASGKSFDGTSVITSENIQDFIPSAETAAKVTEVFTKAGFKVEPVVGNSFSITAPVSVFEKMFGTQLHRQADGGVKALKDDSSSSYELPLKGLPKSITQLIKAVTFTPPPDFGPTNFGP